MSGIGPIVATSVAPPLQPAVVEIGFARVQNRLAARDRGVAILWVHHKIAAANPNEDVLRVRHILSVFFTSCHAELVEEFGNTKDLVAVDRYGCRRIQVRVELRNTWR